MNKHKIMAFVWIVMGIYAACVAFSGNISYGLCFIGLAILIHGEMKWMD